MPNTRLASIILYAAGFGLCAAATAGCLPRPQPPVVIERAPVVDGTTTAEARARARRDYERNRPVPPREFQVPPRPPRDNRFGEFNDDLFRGIDPQPELPPLPANPPAPPAFGGWGGCETPAPEAVPGLSRAPFPTAGSFPYEGSGPAPSGRSDRLPASQGVKAGDHFYPVEQLVFGGDYPDIDKPELYRLMPKDVITVTVRDHPEFSGQMEIQPDGTIKIPNATDLVRLRGLTVEEAANALTRVLSVYIRGEPLVRVQANRARGGYYFVFGDVLQPGRFPMGLEPVRLSEAVLAANWEANPARRDLDGDELGPSFPTASPRGRFTAPRTADMARVMLITPHRSQPVRTIHDVRSALLGVTADDPPIRPGQIIVVPSLVSDRNIELGSASADGTLPGRGFATSSAPARLPETTRTVRRADAAEASSWIETLPTRPEPPTESLVMSPVETNMAGAFLTNRDVAGSEFSVGVTVEKPATIPIVEGPIRQAPDGKEEKESEERTAAGQPWPRRKVVRRERADNPVREPSGTVEGWKKGL